MSSERLLGVPFDFAQDMLCVFARDSVFPLVADIRYMPRRQRP